MPRDDDRSPEEAGEHTPERKPYHTPELVRHGTVAEVTKGGGPTPNTIDGETGYAS
jgi:hypothetical protein